MSASALLGEPLPHKSRRASEVVDRILAALRRGDLKLGDPLPSEGDIALASGVSRPVAREAMRELAASGVVRLHQGRVARIGPLEARPLGQFYDIAASLGLEGLRQANELRRVLEPGIAELAAMRRDDVGLAQLDEALQRMRSAMGDQRAFALADGDFHQAVARTTGNPLLVLQMQGLRPIVDRVSAIFGARLPRNRQAWRATFERHADIAGAIRAGNPNAAGAAMLVHFDAADRALAELADDGWAQ